MIGVAVTRPGDDAGRLGQLLESRGATVVHWPCIRFAPPEDPGALSDAARRLVDYDWLVITSPRAARRWLAAVEEAGGASPGRHPKVAAAGPATAEVLEAGQWRVDRIPRDYSAAGLIAAFESGGDAAGAHVLFPCSDRAGHELPSGLRDLGAEVDRVVAYRTVPTPPDPEEVLEASSSGRVRVVTFTSPSTVEGFLADLRGSARAVVIGRLLSAAIGPTTAEALDENRWPGVVAKEATLEALATVAVERAAVAESESLDRRAAATASDDDGRHEAEEDSG